MTLLMRLIISRAVISIVLQFSGFVIIGLTTSWWAALGLVMFVWGYQIQVQFKTQDVSSLFKKHLGF